MGKSLFIEIRNKNFGAVKGGEFFAAQRRGTSDFGIGDGLFIQPRGYSAKTQYGYEELIQLGFTIIYKDGTTSHVSTAKGQFPMPGKAIEIEVPLTEGKNYPDILSVHLGCTTWAFGYSKKDGGGMSALTEQQIGAASFNQSVKFDGKLVAEISLSDQWDISIDKEDLKSHETHLMQIDFLTRPNDLSNEAWKNIELVREWRSALASYWGINDKAKNQPSILRNDLWLIPIKCLEEGKEGWVVAINPGSQITDSMKKHVESFHQYKLSDAYKKEEQEYCEFWGMKPSANTL